MAADYVRVADRSSGSAVVKMVNRDHVILIGPNASGGYLVTLAGGISVIVSRADMLLLIGGDGANIPVNSA